MPEEVPLDSMGALEGRGAITAPGGTLTRLATARAQPVKGCDLLVVQ